MPKSVSITLATAQDIIRLTELIRTAFGVVAKRFDLTRENCPKHPSNSTEHGVARDLARGVHFYLASVDGERVGCMGIEHASKAACYLERLAVHPKAQGRGVGAALVRHGIAEARRLGVGNVGVAIIAEQSELARWYETLGFTPTGRREIPHLPFSVAFLEYPIDPS